MTDSRKNFNTSKKLLFSSLLLSITCSSHSLAQQEVEFSGAFPLAPPGVSVPELGDGPFFYETGEGMDIQVKVFARISSPTSMTFLPNNQLLVATRKGQIYLVDDGTLRQEAIDGTPNAVWRGETSVPGAIHGYMDIKAHPDFEDNQLIYLSYHKDDEDGNHYLAIGRGQWNGTGIDNFSDIWSAKVTGPGRIAFDQNNKLYITTSGSDPQGLDNAGGKVIRLNDDGSFPEDNPFYNAANAYSGIYTYGHRNGLGLAMHPLTGEIWQNENGPNGGDEVNVLKPGANYGWPLVSLGRTYPGPWQSDKNMPTHDGFEPPLIYWMPAIAVAGMTFYRGDELPKWKGDIFVGALRTGEIPGTGHIERILINENMEEMRRESLLTDLHLRIRDVQSGPDGYIYVATDEEANGAILRIEPAE